MANINVTIRIDEDLKEEADQLFDDLGMSFTTAINVFVKQSLREAFGNVQVVPCPDIDYSDEANFLVAASDGPIDLEGALPYDGDFPGTALRD